MVLAVVILISAIYVGINLITDLLYPILDPRIVTPGRVTAQSRRRSAAADGRSRPLGPSSSAPVQEESVLA